MTIITQVRGKASHIKSILIISELNCYKITSAKIYKSHESDLMIREFRFNIVLNLKVGSKNTYKTSNMKTNSIQYSCLW